MLSMSMIEVWRYAHYYHYYHLPTVSYNPTLMMFLSLICYLFLFSFLCLGFQWKVQNPLHAPEGEMKLCVTRGAASLDGWIQTGAETVTCCCVPTAGCSPRRPLWPLLHLTHIPLWLLCCINITVKHHCVVLEWETLYKKCLFFFLKIMKCFHVKLVVYDFISF